MSRFTFAYKKECFKLLHRKKYIVLVILGILVSIVRYGGTALLARLSEDTIKLTSRLSLEMLPFAVEILAPTVILFAVCDLFATELSNDTMKVSLLQPVSRFKLLTAKAAAALTAGAASLIVMFVVNLIIQIVAGNGFSGMGAAFAAYLIDIVPLVGIVFLGITVNLLIGAPAGAAICSIAVYAAMKYLGLYTSAANTLLFTAAAKLHQMLLGHTLPFGALMCRLGILFGSILILYSVSYIIFDKKNI
ncbi:MAG: ABC transporter permease [Clostridia bacterium]|nr:ABC transporter permease [Clostridia bacterium]